MLDLIIKILDLTRNIITMDWKYISCAWICEKKTLKMWKCWRQGNGGCDCEHYRSFRSTQTARKSGKPWETIGNQQKVGLDRNLNSWSWWHQQKEGKNRDQSCQPVSNKFQGITHKFRCVTCRIALKTGPLTSDVVLRVSLWRSRRKCPGNMMQPLMEFGRYLDGWRWEWDTMGAHTKWYAVVMLPTESLLPRGAPRAWKTWVAVASCPHWIRMAPLFLERRESSPRGYVTKIQRPEHFQIHLYNRLIRIVNQFLWVSQVLTRAISIQSTNNWDL